MKKSDELTRDGTCMNSALPHEMVFVLLARDAAAPVAVDAWVEERIRSGKNVATDSIIVEARACAITMVEQRAAIRRELGKGPDERQDAPSKPLEIVPVGSALFFDENDCGPDPVDVSVQVVPGLPESPNSGGLAIHVAVPKEDFAMFVEDGGFFMKRDTVEKLHAALGKWLKEAA